MKFDKLTKLAIAFGIVWLILSFGFTVFAFNQGKNPFGPIQLIVHGSLVFYMLLSGMLIRWRFNELSFSFKEGLQFCVVLALVGNFSFLLINLAYLNITWETSFHIYFNEMEAFYTQLGESGELETMGEIKENGIEEKIAELSKIKPSDIAFNDFRMKMLVSLILSFIIAVVFRKSTKKE